MLFMIVEHFGHNETLIHDRFTSKGRMMPEGLMYLASWIDPKSSRCFQLMESPDTRLLDEWINNWSDLVTFEVIPVQTSTDYWAGKNHA